VSVQQVAVLVVVHHVVAVLAPEGGVLRGVFVVVCQLLRQGLVACVAGADGVSLLHIYF